MAAASSRNRTLYPPPHDSSFQYPPFPDPTLTTDRILQANTYGAPVYSFNTIQAQPVLDIDYSQSSYDDDFNLWEQLEEDGGDEEDEEDEEDIAELEAELALIPSSPQTQQNMVPRRQPGGFVDLTGSSSPIRPPSTPANNRKRRRPETPSHEENASSGNLGEGNSDASKRQRQAPPEEVDLVDIETDEALEDALKKQREDAVKQQSEGSKESKQLTFSTLQCIICLDTPKDITYTPCGHLFCHSCLNEALAAGETQGPKMSRCPICRTHVKRGNIKPIALKLKVRNTVPSKVAQLNSVLKHATKKSE